MEVISHHGLGAQGQRFVSIRHVRLTGGAEQQHEQGFQVARALRLDDVEEAYGRSLRVSIRGVRREGGAPLAGEARLDRFRVGGLIGEDDHPVQPGPIQQVLKLAFPVHRVRREPLTDGGRTFAEWWAEFDCAPDREAALTEQIGQGVFQAAFDSLKKIVAR